MEMTSNMTCILAMLLFIHNLCWAQNVTWSSNNFKNCVKIGIDNFTMEAVVMRTTTAESFIIKSALFEIKSANTTIDRCSIINFENCGNYPDKLCYCSEKTSADLHIVFNVKSNSSLIGKVVTVSVPCVNTEKTLVSKELVITYLNDTSAFLKIANLKINLSEKVIISKVPVLVEFCSEDSLTHSKAFIRRNDLVIHNESHCVSFTETSNSPFIYYTMFLTLCDQTIQKGDMLFFSKQAKQTEVQTGQGTSCNAETANKESVTCWLSLVISILSALLSISVAILSYRQNKQKAYQDVKRTEQENTLKWMRQEIDNIKEKHDSAAGEDLDLPKHRGKHAEEMEMPNIKIYS